VSLIPVATLPPTSLQILEKLMALNLFMSLGEENSWEKPEAKNPRDPVSRLSFAPRFEIFCFDDYRIMRIRQMRLKL
jgi:hypothetical protein